MSLRWYAIEVHEGPGKGYGLWGSFTATSRAKALAAARKALAGTAWGKLGRGARWRLKARQPA